MSIINSVTSLVTNLVGGYLPDSPSLTSAPQFVQRAFQTVLPFVGYGIAHSKAAPARAHWPSLSVFWRKPGIVTIPLLIDCSVRLLPSCFYTVELSSSTA